MNYHFLKSSLFILIGLSLFSTCDEPKEKDNNEPPTVSITSPENGSIVSEIVIITCVSTDNEKVEYVELWVNNITTGITDDSDPYALEWNTSTQENGIHTFFVRSYDTSGNTSDSDTINLNLYNQCDSGYVEIDSVCYWGEDIKFLQELIDNNDLRIEPTELGSQYWIEGRITSFVCWGCDLSGVIPLEIGNLSYLKQLNLFYNQLSGEIPPEIGNLSNLTSLNLNYNQLTGEIPPEIWDLSNLTSLRLYSNQLSGEIPSEISNLSNLAILHLFSNQLSGEIPPEIGNLSNLTSLNLSDNQLTGEIPHEIGNLSNLTSLRLGENQLYGEIPHEIGNLSNLTSLRLGDNQLYGEIPSEIWNLSNLTSFNIHNNNLSGSIPDDICNLDILFNIDMYFSISQNNFCPPYPDCIENYMGTQDTTGCD